MNYRRRRKTSHGLATRAAIVLACAEGLDNKSVAKRLRLSNATVGKWRARFVESRLDGLLDEPRPGAPRKISDAQVEQAVTLALEGKPEAATHWSTRDMAKRLGVSAMAVTSYLARLGLRPHRVDSFKLSPVRC